MDKGDIDNYAYFQEVWTSPKRYALVKNEFRDGYFVRKPAQTIPTSGHFLVSQRAVGGIKRKGDLYGDF